MTKVIQQKERLDIKNSPFPRRALRQEEISSG
ncbi:uncharacterized protein G2W53_014184 [Senna tora]|uniref:Uncharacterized protein n=1 Tax=Senna tora TaxID=362788 RepID=A0A835C287_9FABA|nr:uncharacterized protein G2W53_014184 [Senna tora]